MKRKLTGILLSILSCITMIAFGMVGCLKTDDNTYSLQINSDNVLVYESEFDFDEYFA